MIMITNFSSAAFMHKFPYEFLDEVKKKSSSESIVVDKYRDFFKFLFKTNLIISPSTSIMNPIICFVAFIFRKKCIIGIHDVVAHEKKDYIKVKIYNYVICLFATRVITFSRFSQAELKKYFNNNSLIYYFGLTKNLRKIDYLNKDIDILIFGRMLPYQGLDLIPTLFDNIKDLKVVLAGKGFSHLKINNKNVEVIGSFIEEDKLDNLLMRTKVFLLPYISATQSGSIPYVATYKCRFIASNVGALPEQISGLGKIIKTINSQSIQDAYDSIIEEPYSEDDYSKWVYNLENQNENFWNFFMELIK